MAFRQYTKCASIGSFVGYKWVQYTLIGGAAVVAGYVTYLLGGAYIPGIMIGILSGIVAYCLWWLYDRLICLGGDVCAVGFVLTVETPEEKSGLDAFDTDYSINIVLLPTKVGSTQAEVEASLPQGNLVKQTSDISGYSFLGYTLPFSGDQVTALSTGDPHGGEFTTACMHAEFEGGGVYDLLQSCYAALAFAAVAAAVCAIPFFGWIACLVLSVIAIVITVAGIVNALDDKGNPDDIAANITSLNPAQTPDGSGADMIVVSGTWVYDSAHTGWNEIHPIKQFQRIGTLEGGEIWNGKDPVTFVDVNTFIGNWCAMVGTANDPITVRDQNLPQNQWTLHPLVDGCQSRLR